MSRLADYLGWFAEAVNWPEDYLKRVEKSMDFQFWTSLIKTPDNNEFLKANCTHVVNNYWIFEGLNELLEDELTAHEIIAEGAVPCLGDLSRKELIDGCANWYGAELEK